MKQAGFGLGLEYDKGAIPAISLNRAGVVLEVHRNELGRSLYFRVGKLSQATIEWGPSTHYGSGNKPHVALNRNNVAFFVNERASGNHLLDRRIGIVEGNTIRWISGQIGYDHGTRPTVAANDDGLAIEMHNAQNSSWVWCQVWQLRGNDAPRVFKARIGGGEAPTVALNNRRDIVMVYYSGRQLVYRVGRFTGNSLELAPGVDFGTGKAPSVALTDDGVVVVTYEIDKTLYHRTGQLSGSRIAWADEAVHYDMGDDSSVAASGTMSVEVHEGQHLKTLWFNASVLTDRAAWMQNRLATHGNTRLGDLVLPASHDAAMYTAGLGETQHLTIYEQLRYGIRYFDLRPKWTGRKFVIAHGPINGPDLSEVLDDIRKFALERRRELAILKLSHFDNINNQRYEEMVRQIQASIGDWLVIPSRIPKKRLADVTLSEYVANGPALLVVVDHNYAIDVARPGFWVYRDWDSATPAQGDLRVFDKYAKTTDFDEMLRDQVRKFANYKGTMEKDPSLPCDLFLLSWTLTPFTAVWEWAKVANRRLGQHVRLDRVPPLRVPNEHGQIVNLLYVDYVESARVTDVALLQSRETLSVAAEAAPRKGRASAVGKPVSARLPVKAAASAKATTTGKARRNPKPRISTKES